MGTRHIGLRSALVWTLVCTVALTARAPAQPAPPVDDARPWAAGVPDSEQAVALELYDAGNREFAEARFAQALAKYREALQHWDHPAIRFNLAVCLIHLDQAVAARRDLERSLGYGAAPLGNDAYAQGLTYRKLLDAQLARVTVTCREPGAEITLDGKLVLTGPGKADEFLLPGEHQIVATRPGFLTVSRTLRLVAGTAVAYEIEPTRETLQASHVARRWAPWKPYAVLAGGGALLAIGAATYFVAARSFHAYDQLVAMDCPGGCTAADLAMHPDLGRSHDRAETEQTIAFSVFAAAGAAVIAGGIALVLNQPRLQIEARPPVPVVAPVPGGATAAVRWTF
jgi:hypothetical protein